MIPDELVLNNTLQIVYDEANEPAKKVVYEGWPVLDDTKFVPILAREMAPADIEYDLHVWFDVSQDYQLKQMSASSLLTAQTYDDGSNRGSFNNMFVNPIRNL